MCWKAIVSVNAIVDSARRDRKKIEFLPKGSGSNSMAIEESTTNDTSTSATKVPSEPFTSNTAMSVNSVGGSSGNNTAKETSTTKYQVGMGETTTTEHEAAGRPTKINVTVSVPREYVVAMMKQAKAGAAPGGSGGAGGGAAGAEPTDDQIATEFDQKVKPKIEEMISPLVETEGATSGAPGTTTQLVAGTVKAFLIPVAMANIGGGGTIGGGGSVGVGSGGGLGGLTKLLEGGLIKTAVLGVLAIVALGMMLTMVRKAGKAPPLPTAEELVGIPPALEPGTDVVGEAVEGDTAMAGIEVDEGSLKTTKMLEEIGALVDQNPSTAANVFNRWLNEQE